MLHLGCLISRATGDSRVMLENTKTAEERPGPRIFATQGKAILDINHASHLNAPIPIFLLKLRSLISNSQGSDV